MPSVSKKQHNLMAACAHGANYPSCPPDKVAKDFNQADIGRSFNGGGTVNSYAKGGMIKDASYAEGGAVLGRTKDFLKTPDRFRDSQFKKGTEDVFGKSDGDSDDMASSKGVPTAPKDKCLTPVKPRG